MSPADSLTLVNVHPYSHAAGRGELGRQCLSSITVGALLLLAEAACSSQPARPTQTAARAGDGRTGSTLPGVETADAGRASPRRFLSDSDPAYRYLEQQQRRIEGAEGSQVDTGALAANTVMATRFTWTNEQWLIDSFSKELQRSVQTFAEYDAQNGSLDSPYVVGKDRIVRIGFLRTICFTAASVRVPESAEYLVMAQFGLFSTADDILRIVLRLIPLVAEPGGTLTLNYDAAGFRAALETNRDLVDRFAQDLALAATSQTMLREPLGGFEARTMKNALGELIHGFELFVFAHEYQHVLRGDTDAGSVKTVPLFAAQLDGAKKDAAVGTLPIRAPLREQELAADAYAVDLALAVLETGWKNETELGWFGGDIYFSYLDLVERTQALLGLAQGDSGYPTAAERKTVFRFALSKLTRDRFAKRLGSHDPGAAVESAFEVLWRLAKPSIEANKAVVAAVRRSCD